MNTACRITSSVLMIVWAALVARDWGTDFVCEAWGDHLEDVVFIGFWDYVLPFGVIPPILLVLGLVGLIRDRWKLYYALCLFVSLLGIAGAWDVLSLYGRDLSICRIVL